MCRYSLGSGKQMPLLISQPRRVCPSILHQFSLLTCMCWPGNNHTGPKSIPCRSQQALGPSSASPAVSGSCHLWDMGFAQGEQRGRWHSSAGERGALAGSSAEDGPNGESIAGPEHLKHLAGRGGFVFACSLSLKAEVRCSPAGDPPKVCGKMQGVDICETFPVNCGGAVTSVLRNYLCASKAEDCVF